MRLRGNALDRAIADGCPPDSRLDLTLRAGQLVHPLSRRRLAASVRRIVAEAESPGPGFSAAVPPHRRAVATWREALLGLADRLARLEPVNPTGVARLRELISDGASPLYDPQSERSLGEMVWWVADGFQ